MERNVLINRRHPESKRLTVGPETPVWWDQRLFAWSCATRSLPASSDGYRPIAKGCRFGEVEVTATIIESALAGPRNLPTPVSSWQVEMGLDATDEPAV